MPFRVIRKSFDGSETEVQQGEAATRIALCRCEEMPARNYYVERRNAIEDLERGLRVLSKNCLYWQEQVGEYDAMAEQLRRQLAELEAKKSSGTAAAPINPVADMTSAQAGAGVPRF